METNKVVYSASTKLKTEETFISADLSLNDLKLMKKQEVNKDFERQLANGSILGYLTQGLTTNVHVYDAKEDLGNYQVALASMQAQSLADRYIKVKEASPFISVTVAELQIILGELAVYGDNLWVRKQGLYNDVDAAIDEISVAAIVW